MSCILDTPTVDLVISGGVLSAHVKRSAAAGNVIDENADGLYAAVPAVGYGVALPASPADGDEFVLVDSVTNPAYQWHLRYNSGSVSAYKWEFVGGTPAQVEVDAQETRANAAYGDLATVGPSFTVPYEGDYAVEIGAAAYTGATPGETYMSYAVGATPAADADRIVQFNHSAAGQPESSISRARRKTGVAAGTGIVAKYRTDGGGTTGNWQYRWLKVTPYRVTT